MMCDDDDDDDNNASLVAFALAYYLAWKFGDLWAGAKVLPVH